MARYLVGERSAIEQVAQSRDCLWLALSFVLLAGFFREYDQEPLWYEPWHLLIPLVASTVIAGLLFWLFTSMFRRNEKHPWRWDRFRQLLTCVWMTAPLAAIYAIPVERFSSAADSVRWNLWFLGIVSVWRVALISRVLSVLFDVRMLVAFYPVMMVSDSLMVFLVAQIPLPLLQIMGGINLSESEIVLSESRLVLLALGTLSWPVWLGGAIWSFTSPPSGTLLDADPGSEPVPLRNSRVAGRCFGLVAVGFAIMLTACVLTQPEQSRRHRVESLLADGYPDQVVEIMSQVQLSDFPPHWDPPPRINWGGDRHQIFKVLGAALSRPDPPAWVVDLYADKLLQYRGFGEYRHREFLHRRSTEELIVLADLIERNPEWEQRMTPESSPSLRCFIVDALNGEFERYVPPMERGKPPPPRELLQRLLKLSSDVDGCPSETEVQQLIDETFADPSAEETMLDTTTLPK